MFYLLVPCALHEVLAWMTCYLDAAWFQIFLEFSPRNLGKISNLTHIFQMGWFNHQLVIIHCLEFLVFSEICLWAWYIHRSSSYPMSWVNICNLSSGIMATKFWKSVDQSGFRLDLHRSIAVSGSLNRLDRYHIITQLAGKLPLIYHLYIANWGIIYHLPPIKGTRKLHWIGSWSTGTWTCSSGTE